ncbi:response regulator transcription factor [Patescibacteria group bacterium]|nr:response regulator transcription factor [Patescibacteria group bacterium]
MTSRILIVDDEKDIVQLAKDALKQEGFKVTAVYNGEDALLEIKRSLPDLVILDRVLPGIDGLTICQKIRSNSRTENLPIIMLTVLDKEVDKLVGLGMGADDYITKPFSVRELTARVKAVLRRSQMSREEQRMENGNLKLDTARHKASLRGESLSLTYTEFKLLEFFIQNKGLALSRVTLLDEVFGEDYSFTTRTVDVYVARLRDKIGKEQIETIRGIGYRFKGENG